MDTLAGFVCRNLLAAGALSASLAVSAADYRIELDTTSLAISNGYMAFDLVKGTPATLNTVVLTGFSGNSVLGTSSRSGNVTGSLPGTVTFNSSGFFNELLQGVSFGSDTTRFLLTVTTNYVAGSVPDQFSIFLLDATLAPYPTTDPTGASALVVFDLTPSLQPQVFTSAVATANVVVVPEPAVWALFGAGLAFLARHQKIRKAVAK